MRFARRLKKISREEGDNRLSPSSIVLRLHFWLKLCGCRRQIVLGDINICQTVAVTVLKLLLPLVGLLQQLCGCWVRGFDELLAIGWKS